MASTWVLRARELLVPGGWQRLTLQWQVRSAMLRVEWQDAKWTWGWTALALSLSVGGGSASGYRFIWSQPQTCQYWHLKGMIGLAASKIDCTRQEAPLALASKHVLWAHVGLGTQEWGLLAWYSPGLKLCRWKSLTWLDSYRVYFGIWLNWKPGIRVYINTQELLLLPHTRAYIR